MTGGSQSFATKTGLRPALCEIPEFGAEVPALAPHAFSDHRCPSCGRERRRLARAVWCPWCDEPPKVRK